MNIAERQTETEGRSTRRWLFVALLPIVFCANSMYAQNEDEKDLLGMSLSELLETRVDLGSSQRTTVFQTPATVSVIDADLIRKYGFRSIPDALETIAGFSVLRTTARQEIPTSRGILQDHYSNKVLFLIDGIPSWSPTSNEMGSLRRIHISQVERIEVLKGPASVLYGTNAFTGAINIVLKRSAAPDTAYGHLSTSFASVEGSGIGGTVLISDADWNLHLAASEFGEQGMDRLFADAQNVSGHFNDFLSYRNATLRAEYGTHAMLVNMYTERQQKLGVDPVWSSALGRPQDLVGWLIGYDGTVTLHPSVNISGGAHYDWQNRIFPRDSAGTTASDVSGWRLGGYVRGHFTWTTAVSIEGGVEYDRRMSTAYKTYNMLTQETYTDANMRNREIYEASAFVQLNYSSAPLRIIAGSRYTKNQYFGANVSSRVSAVYEFNASNSIKLMGGQSFRTPSFFEVFYVHPKRTLGGLTGLRPERSESVEIAYLTTVGDIFLQTTFYASRYMDKIFRVLRPFALLPDGSRGTADARQYTNGALFTSKGVEAELRYRYSIADIFVNYAYSAGDHGDTVGTNASTLSSFAFVPSHSAAVGCSFRVDPFDGAANVRYRSSTIGGLSVRIPGQIRFDAMFGFNHRVASWKVRHQFSIHNIMNADMLVAEYVERGLNSIPADLGRRIMYTLSIDF